MARDAIFVLSDLHFNANSAERRRGIVRFLREVVRRRASALYLNGDVLDYVRGDDATQVETFRPLQAAIDEILGDGIPVTYIAGNHDLPLITLLAPVQGAEDLYSDRPAVELVPGLTLTYRTCRLEYRGHRVHLEHGHVYDPGWLMAPAHQQSLYQTRALQVEGRDWMTPLLRLFTEVPGFGEDGQARLARTGSSIPPFDMARYAVRTLERQNDADWYIFGHFHAPVLEMLEDGRRYANTGDSIDKAGYVVLTDGEIRLGDWQEVLA